MNDAESVPRPALYPYVLGLATVLVVEPALGAPYLSTAHWLSDFYAWPPDRRSGWQRQRLRAVVAHAARQVPFYRTLLGSGADPGSTPLEELPIVDKARMRSGTPQFLSQGWEQMPHVVKATGGTTGDPWRYVLDKNAWAQMYAAALHFRARTDYRYGERMVVLGSPPSLVPGAGSWKSRLRSRLEQRLVSAAGVEIDSRTSLARARRAGELRAALWYGYAGTLAAMAAAVIDSGVHVPGPRAILTTSETLQPSWRDQIEAAFGAPVFDEYGCNDGGVLAQSCRRGRFHVADNLSLVEVLDGDTPCPPGVEGEVVVTNLHARVLPFLRYRVGDRAVAGEGPCPCGQPGNTLARVFGRQGDRVQLPGGGELSAVAFGHVFKQTSSVRRWQVVQDHPRRLRVRLEVSSGFDCTQEELIRTYFSERCGQDVQVALTTSEPIERTLAGKHKVVIRTFDR